MCLSTHKKSYGMRNVQLKKCFYQIGLLQVYEEDVFLTNGWQRRMKLTVDDVTLGGWSWDV